MNTFDVKKSGKKTTSLSLVCDTGATICVFIYTRTFEEARGIVAGTSTFRLFTVANEIKPLVVLASYVRAFLSTDILF
jgi:hypothetical protein